MQSHTIKFPSTAHYYTIGTPSESIQHVFFVLHGYGQLASQIIHKFDALPEQVLVVAPEGLSRFYWNEQKGIVGASWMTKKDRLAAIEDYSSYLQQLYETYCAQLKPTVQVHLLGFSQGGATAVRWLHQNKVPIQTLILWGASFPTDIDYRNEEEYWQHLQKYVVFGRQDQYLTPERIEKQNNFCEQNNLQYQAIWFEGKHVIDRKVLYPLLEQLIK